MTRSLIEKGISGWCFVEPLNSLCCPKSGFFQARILIKEKFQWLYRAEDIFQLYH